MSLSVVRSTSRCSAAPASSSACTATPLLSRRCIFNFPFRQTARPAGTTSTKDGVTLYHERKILPYSQEQLYAVVADVDSYNAFIPMCISSRVLEAKPYGLPGRPWLASDRHHTKPHELRAQLTIGFMGLQEAYTSQVTCQRPTEVKATAEASRTLKHLSSTWAFQPASAASPHPTADGLPQIGKTEAGPTLVSFDLAYQFADPMQQAAAGAFFDRISSKIMGAFEQRCITLYGASSA